MEKRLKDLLNKFVRKIKPFKSDLFSVYVHGSSIYSDELKKHQDIDISIVFKKRDFFVYKKFREFLHDFCMENSNEENHVYYSVAGAGRTSLEKITADKKQIFRFEFFFSYEKAFMTFWKGNYSFPHSVCRNYKILIGEDIKKYLLYTGDLENKSSIFDGFDKFQWVCVSILESNFNKDAIRASALEGLFYDIGNLFLAYDLEERRKNELINKFGKLFPKEYQRFKPLLEEAMRIRKEEKPKLLAISFFNEYQKFNKFIKEKINGKIKKI